MRILTTESGDVKLWLSARDTYDWAHKAGAQWPCSFLADRRVFVEFDGRGDLVDVAIDGGRGEQDCPADELNAIAADYLRRSGKVAVLPACLE